MHSVHRTASKLPVVLAFLCAASQASAQVEKHSRVFEFRYSVSVVDAPKGSNVKFWLPVAQSNAHQDVLPLRIHFPRTAKTEATIEPAYGNKILHLEFEANREAEKVAIAYKVRRLEAQADKVSLTNALKKQFLSANANVPLNGKPAALIGEMNLSGDTLRTGRKLYDIVEKHMTYDKSKPGYGRGDVLWACDSRTGNCTDFHSLFISLARMKQIPAKFEIGFPIGSASSGPIGGYHCWAWFHTDENGWVPVDISEADKHPELKDYYFGKLTADRIAFTTGRDIELVPKPKSNEKLNYFVFPYVEVDGEKWPKEKIQLNFSYKDL